MRGKTENPATARAVTGIGFWKQYSVLLGKELRREMRTLDSVLSMALYAVLVLVVLGATVSQAGERLDMVSVAGGLIWIVIVFTSLLGLNRSFAYEKRDGCMDALLLIPMDRSVIFLSKMTANLLFLLLVEVITVPLFFFLFLSGTDPGSQVYLIIAPLFLGSVGIAGVGTLLSTMTVDARGRDVILAVLFVPLVFPLLYACVGATAAVIMANAEYLVTFTRSLLLAGGYDVVMVLACWALYEFVVNI